MSIFDIDPVDNLVISIVITLLVQTNVGSIEEKNKNTVHSFNKFTMFLVGGYLRN